MIAHGDRWPHLGGGETGIEIDEMKRVDEGTSVRLLAGSRRDVFCCCFSLCVGNLVLTGVNCSVRQGG